MDEHNPCPLCAHDNPSENRFCGSCGTSLTSGGQLVPRLEHTPAATVRALPAKLGPTGKALAAGLAGLAVEAGLLWLRRRAERTGQPSLSIPVDVEPGVSAYLVSQGLEEVHVWLQEGDYHRRISTRWTVRSFRG
jgi:hypothetical protein